MALAFISTEIFIRVNCWLGIAKGKSHLFLYCLLGMI